MSTHNGLSSAGTSSSGPGSSSAQLGPAVALTADKIGSFGAAKVFREWERPVNSLDFFRTGEWCVAASDDESLRVYDCMRGSQHKLLFSKKYGVDLIRYSHDPNSVIAASKNGWDQTIRYLSVRTNQFIRYFKGHRDRVVSLAVSTRDDQFASGSLDGTLRLWDLRSSACQGLMRRRGHIACNFDPEGKVLAVGTGDNRVKLYDRRAVDRGPFDDLIVSMPGTDASLTFELTFTSLSFSPCGSLLLLGSEEGPAFLLNSFSGKTLAVYNSHSNQHKHSLETAFSPDSQFVLSGSDDGRVFVYSATAPYNEVCQWKGGHSSTAPVSAVRFNPRMLMAASAADSLAFWVPQMVDA